MFFFIFLRLFFLYAQVVFVKLSALQVTAMSLLYVATNVLSCEQYICIYIYIYIYLRVLSEQAIFALLHFKVVNIDICYYTTFAKQALTCSNLHFFV